MSMADSLKDGGIFLGDWRRRKLFDAFLLDSGTRGTPAAQDQRLIGRSPTAMVRGHESERSLVIVAGGLTPANVGEAIGDSQALGSGCGFRSGGAAGEEGSGEGAGVCAGGAGDRSEGELEMATVPRTTKVKIPTLARQRTRARMGHPRVSSPRASDSCERAGAVWGLWRAVCAGDFDGGARGTGARV